MVIKDAYGSASTNNITVNPGSTPIENGGINVIMNEDYESINIISTNIPEYWIW